MTRLCAFAGMARSTAGAEIARQSPAPMMVRREISERRCGGSFGDVLFSGIRRLRGSVARMSAATCGEMLENETRISLSLIRATDRSLLRSRDGDQHGHDIVAAVDDLAAFVRADEAGVVRFQHALLAAGNESELARKNVVDFLRGRRVRTGAAAGQKMRKADAEQLRAAGVEPKQTKRAMAAMIGRLIRLGVAQVLHLHQNFSPLSIPTRA